MHLKKVKFKWMPAGPKEYMEILTRSMQYSYDPGSYLRSADGPAGTIERPWRAEIQTKNESYIYLGCYRTAFEAKKACLTAFDNYQDVIYSP